MDLNIINNEVSYTEKAARCDSYSTMRDVSYTTQILLEFKKSLFDLVYTLDNRIENKDIALALSYIVADEFENSNSVSTCEVLQSIEDLITKRSEDLID